MKSNLIINQTVESGINFYAPESIPVISEAVSQAIEEGKSFDLDLQLITAKQNRIWVRAIGQAYRVNGEIVKIGGMLQDISERKQDEENIEISLTKYRVLFDSFPLGITISDKEGNIFESNKKAEILLGLSQEDQINRQIRGPEWNVIRFDGSPFPKEEYASVIALKEDRLVENIEIGIVKGENDITWLNVTAVPIPIENFGVCVTYNDITDRKRAELELILTNEALLQSEKNFHRSISESSLGIRIVTVDGETIYTNKAFLDLFEFNSLEEFTCIPAINRYTPESYAKHQERKEKRKNGHEVFDYEVSIIRKNAEIRHVKVSRKEVLWNGIKHYQLINQDITEQKKLTLDLIEAKEHAEESDRLKSAFLANMSHEIRTPMNGILGFAELLKEPDLTGEQQQAYIRIIEKSGARMLNIINDIVDISKIESGLMKTNVKESNVNEQIEYIYTFFKPEVEEKGMQLFFKNSLPLKEAILKTDREKVSSILINLVKNAIKFSDKGSIVFGYEKKGKYLEYFVKDAGIGIPKDRQKAIFDRFVQADIGDKRAFQGAGLGLSISKALVEMLGGKIWVESEEGKGSTFYFTLPYNTEHEEKTIVENIVLAQDEKKQIKKLKVLIAEDDELSDKLISIVVRKFGKEIINVATGTKAVEACRNNSDIDLVLMDIQMPDMDGYEATRQIRQFNKEVVIIAQTAYALIGDREKAIEAGCNDYISKPIKRDELMELIQKYFKTQETGFYTLGNDHGAR